MSAKFVYITGRPGAGKSLLLNQTGVAVYNTRHMSLYAIKTVLNSPHVIREGVRVSQIVLFDDARPEDEKRIRKVAQETGYNGTIVLAGEVF